MKPFAKWLMWLTSAVTGVTGVVYWWMDTVLEPVDEWAVINHPLQPWVLKAHILAAPLLVFAIGLIAMEHIWRHYRNAVRAGRHTGLSAMWVVGPMILSGYLVQAITHPGWLQATAWLHLVTGLVYLAALGAHQLATRRIRRGGQGPVSRSTSVERRSRAREGSVPTAR